MDERLAEAARDRERLRRRAFVAAWTQRGLLGGGAGLVAVLILGGLLVNRTWNRAWSPTCAELPKVDLTIDQIVDLKQRERAYQSDPADDAMLAVSAEEATALMRGETEFSFEVEVQNDTAIAHILVPAGDGCYDVHYEGAAAIDQRTVVVTPTRLVIGEADFTWWVAGKTWTFERSDLEGYVEPKALDALENAERIELRDGRIWMRLYDPWKLW